jgi:hypothetical protein
MTHRTGSQSSAVGSIRGRSARLVAVRRRRARAQTRDFAARTTDTNSIRHSDGPDHRSGRSSAWLAWGMFILTSVLVLAGGSLTLMSPADHRGHDFGGIPNVVLTLPFVLGNALVGAMVAAKRPANPVGWLVGTCGLLVALDGFARTYAIYGLFIQPGSLPLAALVAWINAWTWQLTFGLMLTVIPLIFPNGRPPSRAWRPLVALALAFVAVWTIGAGFGPRTIYLDWRSDYTLANPFGQAYLTDWWLIIAGERAGPPVALAATIGAVGLVSRLIGARGEERQQLKWIAFAAGVSATGAVLIGAMGAWTGGFALVAFGLTALPLAAGIAILKNRLFDIDVIISNALTYAALTALLAGLYAGVTVLVQRLSVLASGQQSDATLILAAVIAGIAFTPVKNWLQAWVDQRFKSGNAPTQGASRRALERTPDLRPGRSKLPSVVSSGG